MAEKEAKRRIRQPPSVPFLWEVRPGIAKKDWKPLPSSVTMTLPRPTPTPVKLIASVPFNWEEKPGTPLHSFSQAPAEPTTVSPSEMFMTLPPPPSYFNGCNNNDDQGDGGDETDDSFSSAPSTDNGGDHMETLSSPASETDSTSSYATGAASLVGASFLECLFPLLSPSSGFLETGRQPEQRDFGRESNNSVVIRRPPTLGELIMMSRRRSFQRKAAQISEKNISMEFLKERATGCCIFGTDIIELKKFQPRLKFF